MSTTFGRSCESAEAAGRPVIEPPSVLVLEKAANVGDHMLSGAVMNPKAMNELVPDFEEQGFPTQHKCTSDWLKLSRNFSHMLVKLPHKFSLRCDSQNNRFRSLDILGGTAPKGNS